MERRAHGKAKGIWFYLLPVLLILFSAVPLLLAVSTLSGAMKAADNQLEQSFASLLKLCSTNPNRSQLTYEVMKRGADLLLSDGVLAELAASDEADAKDVAVLQEKLAAVQEEVDSSPESPTRVLLSVGVRTLTSTGDAFEDEEVKRFADGIQSALPRFADLQTDMAQSTTCLLNDEQGNMAAMRIQVLLDGAYLMYLRIGGPQATDLLASLRAIDPAASAAYFDCLGNCHAVMGDASLFEGLDYEDLVENESDTGALHFQRGGSPYLACYTLFDDTKTAFCVVVGNDVARAQQNIATIMYGSLIVLMLVSVVIALASSRRFYRQISKIVCQLRKQGDCATESPLNEFEVISDSISAMTKTIESQQERIGRIQLLNTLRGYSGPGEDEPDDGTDEEGMSYWVVGANVDFEAESEADQCSSAELNEHVLGILRTSFALFAESVEGTADNGMMLVVVRARRELVDRVEAACFSVQETLMGEGTALSVYVSGPKDSFAEVPFAYQEVMRMAAYRLSQERYAVVMTYPGFSEAAGVGSSSEYFARVNEFSRSVTKLSASAMLRNLRALKSQNPQALSPYGEADLALLKSVAALALLDAPQMNSASSKQVDAVYRKVNSSRDVKEFQANLIEAIEEVRDLGNVETDATKRFESIVEFLNENYADQNFCAQRIVDEFGLSASSVTRLFKSNTNMGFLEYLHRLRIGKAIELLKGSDATVYEIAAAVGFANTITMSRAFKRHTGKTPSQFRKKK
ncbi:helix-turn-helix domain-containing protein [Arabiibacter massiliensis]|uniref:helix-turn-helix domain-containing protein n=1 Tax=Arabiibacter massiliensis TaxID=1870985 RepID=UPI0009BAAA23|nr:AraC family transcriptional regulator [Arabiibacter massiliensis]